MSANPRRILLTGASSGIGRALAAEYAAPGISLVLLGRDAERLEATAQACRAKGAEVEAFRADVRERAEMRRLIEAAFAKAPVDLLVANAGVATGLMQGDILEDPDAVRAMFAINVTGVFNTVEPAIKPMCDRGAGAIAIVGSMAGVRGLPYSPSYCAAKAATHLWGDSLRGRLAPHGVTVSVVVPGFVVTPMSARTNSWQPGAMSAEKAAKIIRRGLAKKRAVIAFPLYMYWAMRLFGFLPPRLVDAVMRRFPVDVPQTPERLAP